MYKYETHMHTAPVSKCARASVRESLEFYKSMGYAGVFLTNHFIDGNIDVARDLPYEARIEFYFSDYEEALRLQDEVGIKVFLGVEISYKGTDFLIYGLDKAWFLAHPEIENMKKSDELAMMREHGALVIHAHPFREANYIDHIRLFPRCVDGVEILNASRLAFENAMAKQYAEAYDLLTFAGSDNHSAGEMKQLAGLCCGTPLENEQDFIDRVRRGEMYTFSMEV